MGVSFAAKLRCGSTRTYSAATDKERRFSLSGDWVKKWRARAAQPCPCRKSYPHVAMVQYVAMVQSGQDWLAYDNPLSFGGSALLGVLAQSQVCAGLIVIERIQTQNASQMPFTEDQDMIQTVATEDPDQALSIGVLPGRPR